MSEIYEAYSRILVDNHITEDNPRFMSEFDPAQYAAMMKKARVDSAMIYACCHNGNCYYPTKVGHMHRNLNGRDIFGETVKLLKKEGIVPIAYYTAIYHNNAAKNHSKWRTKDCLDNNQSGRFWHCCPNNRDYRQFTREQLAEIVSYDICGIFVDMTFWPAVCFCDSCKAKYAQEAKKEIPRILDWGNPEWVKFQRTRERWLNEFAQEITLSIKKQRPDISVVHQFSPVMLGWHFGQNCEFYKASDYSSGDFYGGKDQQRLATKVFSAFSQKIPYEFMTSRCVSLLDHSSTKSHEEMMCSAVTTYSNGGAAFFIDAINPDGTLNSRMYDQLGKVNSKLLPFNKKTRELKPVLVADVGLYFSMSSHIKQENNGLSLEKILSSSSNMQPMSNIEPVQELLGTSIILGHANIPYRIITEETTDFSGLKTISINNAAFMSEAEVDRIRKFVADGGTLIVTGTTSYYNRDGHTQGDFALNDVFGVSYRGKNSKKVSYLVPDEGNLLLCDYPAPMVHATTAEVLGKVAEPDFEIFDKDHYASIHSNPPGPTGENAGLTINHFGKGKCVYLYSSLLALQQHAQQSFGEMLFKKYVDSDLLVSSNAPGCVEVTILKSTTKNAYLVCFVNYQAELPNVPVHDLIATVKLPDTIAIQSCRRVSDGKELNCKIEGQKITMELSRLEIVEMIELQ